MIRHTVRSNELLSEIADRYGVTLSQVSTWNDGRTLKNIDRGDVVVLKPRQFPRPRQARHIRVRRDDTWQTVASDWGVSIDALRRWNPKQGKTHTLRRGSRLTVWIPSGIHRWPDGTVPRELPAKARVGKGRSVGSPNGGRLQRGVALPRSQDYTIRMARLAYGTSLAVTNIQRALRGFREETGFDGDVLIGALSRKVGRRLPPHKSHQSGRDVDVRLPAMSFAHGRHKLETHEVDWHATFALIDAFIRTGVVSVIFLERKLWRSVKNAGLRLGYSDARIHAVLDRVHHSKGHTSHIHVRFACDRKSRRCKGG